MGSQPISAAPVGIAQKTPPKGDFTPPMARRSRSFWVASPSNASVLFPAFVSSLSTSSNKASERGLRQRRHSLQARHSVSPLSFHPAKSPSLTKSSRLTAENLALLEALDRAQAAADKAFGASPRDSRRASAVESVITTPGGSFVTTPGGEGQVNMWITQRTPETFDQKSDRASDTDSPSGTPTERDSSSASSETPSSPGPQPLGIFDDLGLGRIGQDPPSNPPEASGQNDIFNEDTLLGMLSGHFGGDEPEPLNGGMVRPESPGNGSVVVIDSGEPVLTALAPTQLLSDNESEDSEDGLMTLTQRA